MEEISLMLDETQKFGKDGKAEIVMDYIISYTLRSAMNNKMPIFQKYARKILFTLLDISDTNQKIMSVKVWKQWNYIDLWVEVVLEDQGNKMKYAILIEDKYYSGLHDNQLERYKEIFDEYYVSKQGWEKRYIVITAQHRGTDQFKFQYTEVEKDGVFKVFSINELVKEMISPSESDIFNQFWLGDWN